MQDTHDKRIQAMLERFAQAFTRGDGPGAARCWEVPALVVSDEGSRAVGTLAEVEAFFGGAAAQYHAMGVVDTRPEVKSMRWFTDRLAVVEVQWPYIDAQGRTARQSETSAYVVRIGDDGQPRITAVLMMGVSA